MNHTLQLHSGIHLDTPIDFEIFHKKNRSLPDIRPHNDDEPHWKTPAQLDRDKSKYKDKKVILVVRDPRDTIVSLYFQKTKRWKVEQKSIEEFFWQESGSFKTMISFYNIWAENRSVPKELLLIKYEQLHINPAQTLRTIVDFIGLNSVTDSTIQEAVRLSSFEAMQKREGDGEFKTSRLRPGIQGDGESFKARKGKVHGYVDYLTPDIIESATLYIKQNMDLWYGYLNDHEY